MTATNKGRMMVAYCPDCETDLDQTTGICPSCRWDPILSVQTLENLSPSDMPMVAYDVTDLESGWAAATTKPSTSVSRSRALVLVGLLAMATLYWVVLSVLGMP